VRSSSWAEIMEMWAGAEEWVLVVGFGGTIKGDWD